MDEKVWNKASRPASKWSHKGKDAGKTRAWENQALVPQHEYPVVGYLCFLIPNADGIVNVCGKWMQTRLYKVMI